MSSTASEQPAAEGQAGGERAPPAAGRIHSGAIRIAAAVAIALFALLWWGVNSWYAQQELRNSRSELTVEASHYVERLSAAVNRRLDLLEGLHAYVSVSGTQELERSFTAFARSLSSGARGVRNLTVAPGGVNRWVYPLEGNEEVPGHDLLQDERAEVRWDVRRALRTGRVSTSGPYELRQGGAGLVARKAVFEEGRFRALVGVVVDMHSLYREAGLLEEETGLLFSLTDGTGRIFFSNAEEAGHLEVSQALQLPDERWRFWIDYEEGLRRHIDRRLRLFRLTSFLLLIMTALLVLLLEGRAERLQWVVQRTDIHYRQEAEQRRASEYMYRNLFTSIRDTVVIADTERRIIDINQPALREMFGYELAELLGRRTSSLYAEAENYHTSGREVFDRKGRHIGKLMEIPFRRKSGESFPAELYALKLYDDEGRVIGNLGIIRDITERKEAERKIAAELGEKQVLLRELHHRVKNNLNVVASLLTLQADELSSLEQARDAFYNSRNRIYSMALVHELLYRSNSIADIKMQLYLGSLARDLVDSLSGSIQVKVELQVEDLQLHINDAVPCGIIVNELITNAVTHGLAGRSSGRVEVMLRQLDTERYELRVSDDGVGLPEGFDPEDSASLGLRLVSILAVQLGGQLSVHSAPKAVFSVSFSPER